MYIFCPSVPEILMLTNSLPANQGENRGYIHKNIYCAFGTITCLETVQLLDSAAL